MAATLIKAVEEACQEHERKVTVDEIREHYFTYRPKTLTRELTRQITNGNVERSWDHEENTFVYQPAQ